MNAARPNPELPEPRSRHKARKARSSNPLVHNYYEAREKREAVKLSPGGVYVTAEDIDLVTVLGSCIAACIRDPVTGVGGMNHFMLPENLTGDGSSSRAPAGHAHRYGCFAMEFLINQILKAGGQKERLEVKIFGGANMLAGMRPIGTLNIEFVRHYLASEKIRIQAEDLGGTAARRVKYHPPTGRSFLWRTAESQVHLLLERETKYQQSLAAAPSGGEIELF